MAVENLGVFIGGQWEEQSKRFAQVADEMVGNIERISKAGKGIVINFGGVSSGKEFKEQAQAAIQAQRELAAQAKALEAQTKQLQASEQQRLKTQQESSKADIQAAKAIQEKDKAEQQSVKTAREHAKAIHEKWKQQQEVEKQLKREEAALKKSQSAYNQLNTKYKETAEAAQNLGAKVELMKTAMGETAAPGDRARIDALQKEFEETAASANKMHVQLLKIDESVGKSQRNVGNYKSQWNGLNFSIQQMVREVPSTINNLAMLPLALSNNIGGFIDAIKQARVANEALKASGQATVPVWKQVSSAIFSWQTALMAAIAVVISYLSASDSAIQKTGDFAEALKSASSGAAEAAVKLGAWSDALKSGTMSMEAKQVAMEEYNKEFGDQIGHAENLIEFERILVEKAPAYIEVLFLRAKATAALSAATELLVENMKNQANGGKDLVTAWDKIKVAFTVSGASQVYAKQKTDALTKANEETGKSVDALKKKYEEYFEAAAVASKKYGFDFVKDKKTPKGDKPDDLSNMINETRKEGIDAISEYEIQSYEENAVFFKQMADDEQRTLDERIGYYQEYYERKSSIINQEEYKETQLLKLEREKRLADIDKSDAVATQKAEARQAAEDAYVQKMLVAEENANKKRADLQVKAEDDRKEMMESSMKGQMKAIIDGAVDIENQIRDSEYRKLETLETAKKNGLITQQEYERRRKEIITNSNNDVAAAQRQYFINEIDELERNGQLSVEIARKLRKEISQLTTSPTQGVQETSLNSVLGLNEKGIREAQGYADAVTQIINSIGNLVHQQYQNRIDELEREKQATSDNYNQEVEYINSLSLTDEERQERLAELKAKNTLAELEQNRRITDVKRRQARAEKTANTAETVGKTAIAVMNALSVQPWYLGVALAAAAGITGAAQIAAIQSTPLPQYYTGTDSAAQGWAWTGERGRELIVGDNGVSLTPSQPTLTYLKGGEKIFTAEETDKLLKQGALKYLAVSGKKVDQYMYMQALIESGEKNTDKIVRALGRQKAPVVHVHDSSYQNYITKH